MCLTTRLPPYTMPSSDTKKKVVVVTGANRGLGLGVVRALARHYMEQEQEFVVYLTARDQERGQQAMELLQGEGVRGVVCHQLDITDQTSVETLAKHIRGEHGGLDVLVNNAGVAFKNNSEVSFGEQAEVTLATNYHGTRRVMACLVPMLRRGGRVVVVTSNCGHLSKIRGQEPESGLLRGRLASLDLTQVQLTQMMEDFVVLARAGRHLEAGWPDSAYKVSKVGVSALARVVQMEVDSDRGVGEDIVINHAHPGWVSTDMTSRKGHWSVEQGVRSLVHCATLPPDTQVRGQYVWEDCRVTSWEEEKVCLFY